MTVLVARKAPDFQTAAVLANGEIKGDYKLTDAIKGKYAILFFYPLDFTFVCPSELIALNNRIAQFKERNVEVIGVSIDSQFTHSAWRNTPPSKGGIGKLDYTLVADVNHRVCLSYGVEHPEAGVAFRAAFIIDKEGVVRSQIVNDLPIGRNIDEIIRIIDALQFHEKHGEVCPAGWEKGKEGMKPTAQGVASYLEGNEAQL